MEQTWAVWPQNDRLKRWCVVRASDPGRGKSVVAANIRTGGGSRANCRSP